MAQCHSCKGPVAAHADYCPHCGQRNPGENPLGCAMAFALASVFLLPAIIFIWPFSDGFIHAVFTALTSLLAWTWSLAFWGFCLLIWSKKGDPPNLRPYIVVMIVPFFVVLPISGFTALRGWRHEVHLENQEEHILTNAPVAVLLMEQVAGFQRDAAEALLERNPEVVMTDEGVYWEGSRYASTLYRPADAKTAFVLKTVVQPKKGSPVHGDDTAERTSYEIVYAAFVGDECVDEANQWLRNRDLREIEMPLSEVEAGSSLVTFNETTEPTCKAVLFYEQGNEMLVAEKALHSLSAEFRNATAEDRLLLRAAQEEAKVR